MKINAGRFDGFVLPGQLYLVALADTQTVYPTDWSMLAICVRATNDAAVRENAAYKSAVYCVMMTFVMLQKKIE